MVREIKSETEDESEHQASEEARALSSSFRLSPEDVNFLWNFRAPNEMCQVRCSTSVLFPLLTNQRLKAVVRRRCC